MLLDQIGAGGQAAVYRGVQESTGRVVAAKVMAGGSLGDSRHRTRFEREAEILAALRHPNIVNIIDRGRTASGDFYFLMEFVDGCELDEWWMTQPQSFTGTRSVIELFVKVCRAVQEAHARDIVHRDLKPSNIRVDERGEPRVLDFGLARPAWNSRAWTVAAAAARRVTVTGQLLGSVPWASPEQAAGDCEQLARQRRLLAWHHAPPRSHGRFPYAVDGPLHQVLDRIAHAAPTAPSSRRGCRPPRVHEQTSTRLCSRHCPRAGPALRVRGLPRRRLGPRARRPTGFRPSSNASPRTRRACVIGMLALAGIAAVTHYAGPSEPPVVFEMPSEVNTVGMRLVRVPAGTFTMGSPQRETGRDPAEIQQRVTGQGSLRRRA